MLACTRPAGRSSSPVSLVPPPPAACAPKGYISLLPGARTHSHASLRTTAAVLLPLRKTVLTACSDQRASAPGSLHGCRPARTHSLSHASLPPRRKISPCSQKMPRRLRRHLFFCSVPRARLRRVGLCTRLRAQCCAGHLCPEGVYFPAPGCSDALLCVLLRLPLEPHLKGVRMLLLTELHLVVDRIDKAC